MRTTLTGARGDPISEEALAFARRTPRRAPRSLSAAPLPSRRLPTGQVIVLSDDAPGVLSLVDDELRVHEGKSGVTLKLRREEGHKGVISCSVKTKDGRAIGGSDYLALDETITFADGEVEKTVKVSINDDEHYEGDEDFQVIFADATGGARFHNDCNGGPQRAVAHVTIVCDDEHDTGLFNCRQTIVRCGFNFDAFNMVRNEWYEQFAEAIAYEGCADDHDAEENPSLLGYVVSLPWKLSFAFAPPPSLMDGWACFFIVLALIGVLTAVIGDLAAHLGCCLGISKSITAITFVALGTSLPDTFASYTAATSEDNADSSIGNITGSNSVNVFLGLGLPWGIAALYWSRWATPAATDDWHLRYGSESWYVDGMPIAFAVPAGNLAFSVAVFTVCALLTLGTLMLRRATVGYELGMAHTKPTALFFVGLWFVYIFVSIWYEKKNA